MRAGRAWVAGAVLWVCAGGAAAQTAEQLLQQARAAREAGAFPRAIELTRAYLVQQPGDGGAHWMLGQLLYWNKQYGDAVSAYDVALGLLPNDASLRIDFARMLYELQRYRHAARVIAPVAQAEPANAEARRILANVRAASAPWINLGISLSADDQPRQTVAGHFEGVRLLTDAVTVRASATPRLLRSDEPYESSRIDAAAGFSAAASRIAASISLGAATNGDMWKPIGTARVETTLAPAAKLTASVERDVYEGTLASLDSLVVATAIDAGLDAANGPGWAGALRFRLERYDDANTVNTAYAWVLAPVASTLRLGYAAAWQDSRESRWGPRERRPPSRGPAPRPGPISGQYTPYYTPNDVHTHSALLAGRVRAGNGELAARATLPLYARELAPVLTSSGQQTQLAFSPRRYRPWSGAVTWTGPARPVSWTVETQYQRAAYYSFGQLTVRASWRPGAHAQ